MKKFALNLGKKMLPKISNTERAALVSGTVGFDRILFTGNPKLKDLVQKYKLSLTPEENNFIDNKVNNLCKMVNESQVMKDRDLTQDSWNYIKDNKFFGLCIPKQYSGLGFSAYAHSQIVTKVSSHSGTLGVSVMVPNSLGPGELLLNYGTEEQKNKYLNPLAEGKIVPCFGLTGPSSGSDAASMPDTGKVVIRDGVKGVEVKLNKRYITLAPIADVIGIAFKLEDPDGLLEKGEEGITLALIGRDTEGLEIGKRHDPIGNAFMNGPIKTDKIFVKMEDIIGGEERSGYGWNMLMECLAEGRGISLPASAVGGMKMLSNSVGGFARIRKQFKIPIAKMEGIQEKLAEMVKDTYTITASQELMNAILLQHEKPSVLSGVMKQQSTEKARKVIEHSMDIMAGSAICKGDNNFVANLYQSIPVPITVEGSNTLTRSLIIFGQGLVRSHPYLLDAIYSIENNDQDALFKNVKNIVGHSVKTSAQSITKSVFRSRSKSNLINYYESQLERMTLAFAASANISLLLGGKIKMAEMLSGRYADVFSNLFHGYALLWKNHDKIQDERLLAYCLDSLLYEMQESLDQISKNYPDKTLGFLVKAVTFPFGKSYSLPTDDTRRYVADLVTKESIIRDEFMKGIYIPDDKENVLYKVNNYIKEFVEDDESELCKKIRDEVIQVGEFDKANF